MAKKWFAAGMLLMIFSLGWMQAWAEQIVIESCGEDCRGHVISGDSRISIHSGSHQVELDGVHIDVSDEENACAFYMEKDTEVFLTLKNNNTLKSGTGCAGIQISDTAALTISADSTGFLKVSGLDGGAGIGGGREMNSGTIVIDGGIIVASGLSRTDSNGGAAIGSGYCGRSGSITITGGIINAEGNSGAAGIGGGCSGSIESIHITGGIIDANCPEGWSGAGIGSGVNGDATTIIIDGGIINAYTGYDSGKITGPGIGGFYCTIKIRNGMVYAEAGCDAAGIGASGSDDHGNISIEGGFVEAMGGSYGGAGIGGRPAGPGQGLVYAAGR